MPLRKICLVLCMLMCLAVSALAQQANFSADKTSGCSPLAISFTNTSTGFSSAAVYSWNFGNSNTSALENPGTTYKDEGTYTVTLTVSDGNKTSSQSMQITVYKKPVVDFSVDITKGCAPLPVTFTSSSTPGDGTIDAYTWDFGDGIALAGAGSLSHTYNIAKLISPSLTVTNSYGCYSTLSKQELIDVRAAVIASFKPDKTVLCNVQDALTLTNTSAGTGTLTYNWDFGDGNTSATTEPQHTYNLPGIYPVKLSATSKDGCVSDTTISLNVADYHTDFTVPPLICQNSSSVFIDKSTPIATTQKWFINGNATTDTTLFQLQHTFSKPGTYKILLANIYETCPDTSSKTITVQPAPPTTGFVAQLQGDCGAPVSVQFIDTTKGATAWQWDFSGNGIFTNGTQNQSYLFSSDGTYNVTLQTTGANGCTTKVSQPVTVHKATVDIKSSEGDLGCETKTTIFSALTQENLTSYNWDFGDGSTPSTDTAPTHTFTSPGDYTVTLNYVSASGCKGTSTYLIHVDVKPEFNFTALPGTTVCGNSPVNFLVTGPHLEGTYLWNFGDSATYSSSVPSPYMHRYQNDSVYTVSLIIDNNGCKDTVTKPAYITVFPPFPHISGVANTCDGTRGLITFADTSYKATSYSWNFGDNSAPYSYKSHQRIVQHTYGSTGIFLATLTTTNGTCSATDSVVVYVLLKQSPLLSAPSSVFCSDDILNTTLSALEKNPVIDSVKGYKLTTVQYGDGSIYSGTAQLAYSGTPNTFNIGLSNLNVNQTQLRILTTSRFFGCQDTTNYLPYQALGPVAAFSVSQNNLCFKTPAVFIDGSKPSHNSPIVNWQWSFGDSSYQNNKQENTVTHLYAIPGNYNAILTVTDANNCQSSASLPDSFVIVKGPKAAFSISENPVLPATNVFFYNHTNTLNTIIENNKYTWNFGDSVIIKDKTFTDSVTHRYKKESIDTVTLIATNVAEHCADTTSGVIIVKNPNLDFTYSTTYVNPDAGCPPVIASFVNHSINTKRISWDFGDGNTADNLDNASHIYEKPGVYKVTLYGYFLDGTVDSVYQTITIKGPYATLQTVKPFACGAELITLTASTTNSKNFTWDFGDGTLFNNADTFANHRYLTPGVYTPSLIVNDSNNCKFPFFLSKPIIIDTLHLQINQNAQVACDSSLLYFTPTIVSEAKNELGLPLTYHWSFGTGIAKDTANTENSHFIYNKTGSYEIILRSSSPFGCVNTTVDTVIVQPTPRAYIAGATQICQDDSVIFTSTATRPVTWSWQFQNGNISSEQNPALQVYKTPGLDSVSLIVNSNGCYDTAWHPLLVNARPVINPSPLSAHICQGDSVQLQAHDGTIYNWMPDQHINQSNVAKPFVFPDTATKYFVEVKNAEGCTSNDSITIDVTQRFTVTAPSPVYICPGGIAQLNAYGADNYLWLNNDVSNTGIANPTTSVYVPQTYTVVGSDKYGCFTDTVSTKVLTANLPTISAGADITTFAGTPVQLSPTGSNDIVKWLWTPGSYLDCDTCANAVVTPRADLQYILKVTNRSGCVAYDTLQITILCKLSQVQIPSAFTPNGDGKNDYFTILGRGIKEIRHFAVFDRLGEKLFEKENCVIGETGLTGWDGTFNNKPMAPGTYVFMADLICDTGELFHYKGTVVLIR